MWKVLECGKLYYMESFEMWKVVVRGKLLIVKSSEMWKVLGCEKL